MSIQIPSPENGYTILLRLHVEDCLTGDGIEIMPAISVYMTLPNQAKSTHHHCVILDKLPPQDDEAGAIDIAGRVMDDVDNRLALLSVIIDKIKDFEAPTSG